ncbi:unnamed protein product [Blepharisma stoltei]|uniref:RNA helicase n=1 Tax=Blepharisma stoltei TaxID=1481888 RepID=A0AAU9IFY5_9CILI|nr:unnamed protein product [Blepharisma stoltei]
MKATIGVPAFAKFGLLPELCECLELHGIKLPTPIQSQVIPSMLKFTDHHLIAAQTGTGKTLAYLLPIFNLLKEQELAKQSILTQPCAPRALIVVPNRELTKQCVDVMGMLKHHARLKVFGVHNGNAMKTEKRELSDGIDICVGTPDRLDKHLRMRTLDFRYLSHIVIDEADTMVDGGYVDFIDQYAQEIKRTQGKMSFVAATLPRLLETVISKHFSFKPDGRLPFIKKIIEEKTHMNLTHLRHEFIHLGEFNKNPTLLKHVADIYPYLKSGGCMVFCNTIQSARATEYTLTESGFKAVSLHGDIPPKKRNEFIEKFKAREVPILVCTDLASRGLDFPFLNYVIQYDFPRTISDYVHRAGRAGRGGKPGTVLTFYRNKDYEVIKELQKSYDTNTPLSITTSAYSFTNKEDMKKFPIERFKNTIKK